MTAPILNAKKSLSNFPPFLSKHFQLSYGPKTRNNSYNRDHQTIGQCGKCASNNAISPFNRQVSFTINFFGERRETDRVRWFFLALANLWQDRMQNRTSTYHLHLLVCQSCLSRCSIHPTRCRSKRSLRHLRSVKLTSIQSAFHYLPIISDILLIKKLYTWHHRKKEMVEKRASNVLRLAQESEKLNAELKALADRLRAAEERAKQAEERRREREARERERALEQVQVLDDVSTP